MSDSESEYDGAEAYIKKRETVRRTGQPFSTDIPEREEYEKYEPLFAQVYSGAAQLETTCLGYKNKLEGQMGMVNFGMSDDGDDIRAVTALHNILERPNASPQMTTCTFSGKRHNETFAVEFPLMGTHVRKVKQFELPINNTTTNWEYGVDIVAGTFPPPTPLSSTLQRFHVFQPVNPGYQYTVGTKIAMSIFTKQAATLDSARIKQKDVNPAIVYGPADEISIYVGMITHVFDKFFVHDINSYRGCSGAVVFLLDGPNAGMCIGVHVGSPTEIEPAVNLAFKIYESPTIVTSPSGKGNG